MYLRFTTLLLVVGIFLGPAPASDDPVLGVEGSDEGIAAQLRSAEHEFRKKWGGITAEELAPGPVKPERNRALRIIEAVELFEAAADAAWMEDWRSISADYSVTGAGEFADRHEAEMARLEPAIAILDTIDLLPESNFGLRYDQFWDAIPFRGMKAINLVRLLSLSGLAELSAGHCSVTIRRAEVLLAIGEACAGEPNGVMQIHRTHADQQALVLLRAVLSRCDLTRKELERLLLLLDRDSPSPVEMMLFDNVVYLYRLLDLAGEEPTASTDEDAKSRARAVAAAKLQTLRFLGQWFEFVTTKRAFRGEPPSLSDYRVRAFDEVEVLFETPEHEPAEETVELGVNAETDLALVLHMAFHGFEKWVDRSDLRHTRFLLARTALALEMYAKDHEGAFPRELRQLVPHYVGQISDNPFSGEPLEYESTETGYRLAGGEDAENHWTADLDSALDWSRSGDRRGQSPRPAPPEDSSSPGPPKRPPE